MLRDLTHPSWIVVHRFLAIPFLLELRALMDWIWTDSTLAISSWLQMEDIYANIFVLKCWRHSEIVSVFAACCVCVMRVCGLRLFLFFSDCVCVVW